MIARASSYTLITGGAGFIGSNLAHRLLAKGRTVLLLDNLSRGAVLRNVEWLRSEHGARARLLVGDVRSEATVRRAVEHAEQVFHFAAQVAVTTSLVEPIEDFEVNALGTLRVLEAIRQRKSPPPLVFTSTNKVYGGLDDVALLERESRYEPEDPRLSAGGIDESRALDFHSPYGCSKGTADQYVIDYTRSFGLRAVVFRMSCIYGPRQFGTEDQGWVAHFLIRARRGEPITIYGDGKQVRDVLFVDDLVRALLLAEAHMDTLSGQAFNIGGGPRNAISLRELLQAIERMTGRAPKIEQQPWRVGDQRYYVSDTRKFASATGWEPKVTVPRGLEHLARWVGEMTSFEREPQDVAMPLRAQL